MKRLLLMACFVTLSAAQQGAPVPSTVPGEWMSNSQHLYDDGHAVHFRGNVELRTGGLLFRADAADYDHDKATLRLIGHVVIETGKSTFNADEAEYDAASGDLTLKLKLTPAH